MKDKAAKIAGYVILICLGLWVGIAIVSAAFAPNPDGKLSDADRMFEEARKEHCTRLGRKYFDCYRGASDCSAFYQSKRWVSETYRDSDVMICAQKPDFLVPGAE